MCVGVQYSVRLNVCHIQVNFYFKNAFQVALDLWISSATRDFSRDSSCAIALCFLFIAV